MKIRIHVFAFAAAAFAVCAATPAGAQSHQHVRWCNGLDGATPDQQISGCTGMIQSGKSDRKNLAIAYANRAAAYNSKKQYDRAIADCTRAIELDPKYAAGYVNRGNGYARKKQYDRAIADFSQAIKLNPELWQYYYNRGKVYS
jgi:tetratricopeptide (TPR) repeat protein